MSTKKFQGQNFFCWPHLHIFLGNIFGNLRTGQVKTGQRDPKLDVFVIFWLILTPDPKWFRLNAFSVAILVSFTLARWTLFQNFWKIYILCYISSSQISGRDFRSTLMSTSATLFMYLPWQYICKPQNIFFAKVENLYITLCQILYKFGQNYFWYKIIKRN